jgi:hypothetical protein
LKYVVDIPGALEQKVRDVIAKGEFRDVNHFVNVAVENQLNAEQASWSKPFLDSIPNGASSTIEDLPASSAVHENPSVKMTREAEDQEILDKILWGQYYRFLPVKLSLRLLANQSGDFPRLASFKDVACSAAEDLGAQLRKLDLASGKKSGEKISVSFPEHNDKSRRRFKEQYIGFVRSSDKKSSGMLLTLRFARVFADKQAEVIGLTESGKQFAALENPVLDKHLAAPIFSANETEFIVKHVCEKLPQEALHMGIILDNLLHGGKGRSDLNSSLDGFYRRFQPPGRTWTKDMINLMRAGAMSRMWELGMIKKERSGLLVTYKATALGESYRPELIGAGSE